MRSGIILLVVFAFTAGAMGDTRAQVRQLQERLKVMEAEQKRLRIELATARLRIATLQRQLEEASDASASGESLATDDEDVAGGDDSTWEVEVVENSAADKTDLQAKIRAQQARVRNASSALARAKERLSYMKTENKKKYKYDEEPFSSTDIDRQQADITKAASTHRAAIVIVKKYERELAELDSVRRVTVKNVTDGSVLTVIGRGNTLSPAQSMQVGRRYRVEGRRVGDNVFVRQVSPL